MEGRLGLTWGLSSIHGWGVFGINLVRTLLTRQDQGWPRPLLLNETTLSIISEDIWPILTPLIEEQQRLAQNSAHLQHVSLRDTVLLHSSGNGLIHHATSARYTGTRNFGFTFFEETAIGGDAIQAAAGLDGMRTGSNWNRDYLRARGLNDVVCVHQGVDSDAFYPRDASGRFAGRFVIFSGGKLEFRKGQDLVIAAFKAFHARHADALLVTLWQNPWPESIASMTESPHLQGLPADSHDPKKNMPAWTVTEGIPEGAHLDFGVIGNSTIPEILREADAAVFPNRCEGGTNLAAMECMASGIPCIVSMNTGHLDIATADNCFPLIRQVPVVDPHGLRQGWGESDVEEIVERLEEIYTDRAEATTRAERAVAAMRLMNWDNQVGKLVASFET